MFGFTRRTPPVAPPCTHAGALPRWERIEDMGDTQKAHRLFCPDCDRFVPSPESSPEGRSAQTEPRGRPS
jgi:hypothetical protein